MVYRKTEKVRARLEAKRHAIMAAALDVIAKDGMAGLTTKAVAARAELSEGLMYFYFPDKTELVAEIFGTLLGRDLAAIREASEAESNPLAALTAAMTVFFNRLKQPHLVRASAEAPVYRLGIRDDLARLIRAATDDVSPKDATLAAAGALGALYGFYDVSGHSKNRAWAAVLFALKGIGVSDAQARKAINRYSMATA